MTAALLIWVGAVPLAAFAAVKWASMVPLDRAAMSIAVPVMTAAMFVFTAGMLRIVFVPLADAARSDAVLAAVICWPLVVLAVTSWAGLWRHPKGPRP